MGHNKSFSADDDFEFDEAYFRTVYKPLSNLPTPPPSTRCSSLAQSPRFSSEDVEKHNEALLAPAIYLTRVTPPGLSIESPSVSTVRTMLSHADLPMDTIALAACILDALPTRFKHKWRVMYPRSRHTSPPTKRHTFPAGPIQPPSSEAVFPEVVVLAALIIATKFVDDFQDSTQVYSRVWGQDMWSCEQINVSERCIMEALEYRVLPYYESDFIKQARHDIELIRRDLLDESSDEYEVYGAKHMSTGQAVVGFGLQLTPAETPKSELSPPFCSTEVLDQETREAFRKAGSIPQNYLHLPSAMDED